MVSSGREEVPAARSGKFDLVAMEVQMPDMDGLEGRLQSAAGRKRLAHIPIIAMTAQAMKGDRGRCLDVGMDGYTEPLS